MRKQKAYIVLSILSAAILALSGCGAAAGGEVASGSVSAGNATQQTQLNDAVYVQVQSIDGDTVTVLIGAMTESTGQPENAQGKQGGAQQGAPQMPAGDGTQNGAMPGGQNPQGRQRGRLAFTAGDAVLLFQVSELTIVTRQNGPETTEAALSDLAAGDILALTLSGDNTAETIVILSMNDGFDPSQAGGQPGAGFDGSDTVTNGTAASTIDTDTSVSAETYASDGDDENALRIDGATVSLSGITVSKTGGASSNTDNDTLLNVAGNSSARGWGTAGANGGTCTFTASNQTLKGNILVDGISGLDFRLADGSVFTGAINSAQAGSVSVTLGSGCQWVLTGDSYLASFTGDVSQIVTGGFTVFVNGTAITA